MLVQWINDKFLPDNNIIFFIVLGPSPTKQPGSVKHLDKPALTEF